MKYAVIALAFLAACSTTGDIDPRVAPTVNALTCLPKGVYLGAAFGATYTEAQIAIIDVWRIANCPNALELGYGAVAE